MVGVLCVVMAVRAEGEAGAVEVDLLADWVQTVPSFPDGVPRARNELDAILGFLGGLEVPTTDVAAGPDGSVYLLCNVMPLRAGELNNHVVLVKYSADGQREWYKQVAPPEGGMICAFGLAVDRAGGAYVSGWYQRTEDRRVLQHGYVASYAADGDSRWSYEVANVEQGSTSKFIGVAVAGDRVFAVGTATGQAVRSAGAFARQGSSTLAVCINARNGREAWSQQYLSGEAGSSEGIGVAVTSKGRVCISGNFSPHPNQRQAGGANAGFVLGLGRDGGQDWSVEVGRDLMWADAKPGEFSSGAYYLAAGLSDEVYVYGSASEGRDRPVEGQRIAERVSPRLMSRISGEGRVVWTRRMPLDFGDLGRGIHQGRHAVGPDGMLYVPGIVGGLVGRPCILRFDAEGNVAETRALSSQRYYDELDAIAFGSDGGVLVSGQHVVMGGAGGGGLFNDDGVQRQEPNRQPAQPPVYFVARIDVAAE